MDNFVTAIKYKIGMYKNVCAQHLHEVPIHQGKSVYPVPTLWQQGQQAWQK